jgi:hypothetical protein
MTGKHGLGYPVGSWYLAAFHTGLGDRDMGHWHTDRRASLQSFALAQSTRIEKED